MGRGSAKELLDTLGARPAREGCLSNFSSPELRMIVIWLSKLSHVALLRARSRRYVFENPNNLAGTHITRLMDELTLHLLRGRFDCWVKKVLEVAQIDVFLFQDCTKLLQPEVSQDVFHSVCGIIPRSSNCYWL